MVTLRYLFLILLGIFPLFTKGQSRIPVQVSGSTSAQTLIHDGKLPPMWQVARQEGRWNYLGGSQVLGMASVNLSGSLASHLTFDGQVEMDYRTSRSGILLHTGWAGIRWKSLSIKAGKHRFAPIFSSPYSGSGSYLFGDNYQPMSRVTLELADYVTLPFARNKLEVKGGISQGWLNEDRGPIGNRNVLLHEKYGYLRWKGQKWRPYLGLNHSSLFGGTNPDGKAIPVDYFSTFFAHGSEKIGGGEATNAAGAHMGLFDFGAYVNTGLGPIQLYYQIPFADGSGMYFFHDNTDHITGVNWNPVGIKWLTNLTVEWIQTTHQSGNGMPDPGAIVDGKYVSISKIMYEEPTTEFMLQNFGIDQETWTWKEVKQVLKERVNHGNEFAGRDGYMNNWLYSGAWTCQGQVMGNPLNLTFQQLNSAIPNAVVGNRQAIGNDRFEALHVGGKGYLSRQLGWNAMITYSRNFGSYYAQYPGRYTWEEAENYWFKGGRNQWYTQLGFQWSPRRLSRLTINGSIAWDAGAIYHSKGLSGGITYAIP